MNQEFVRDLQGRLKEYGVQLVEQGLTTGTGGNISRRVNDEYIVISPSGIPYDEITPRNIPVLDLTGKRAHGNRDPSVEFPMHKTVYQTRDDVTAVVHTHSTYASTLACLGKPIPPSHYTIASIGDKVPVTDYATFGTEQLGKTVVNTLGQEYDACLLKNHGVLAVGGSLRQAFNNALTVEFCARVHYLSQSLDEPALLPEEELDRLDSKFAEYGQQ